MKTIISPAEAVSTAWAGGEYVSPQAVSEADVAAAEHRHIVPVTGRALAEALADGRYDELRRDYVLPALAMYVRILVQPAMDVRTGQAGSVVQRGTCAEAASAEARAASMASLRRRAGRLLRRLSDRLDAAAEEYPEYDPRQNILKRCSTDGGIVQIR